VIGRGHRGELAFSYVELEIEERVLAGLETESWLFMTLPPWAAFEGRQALRELARARDRRERTVRCRCRRLARPRVRELRELAENQDIAVVRARAASARRTCSASRRAAPDERRVAVDAVLVERAVVEEVSGSVILTPSGGFPRMLRAIPQTTRRACRASDDCPGAVMK